MEKKETSKEGELLSAIYRMAERHLVGDLPLQHQVSILHERLAAIRAIAYSYRNNAEGIIRRDEKP